MAYIIRAVFYSTITVNDTNLTFHWVCVDLAHVFSSVLLLHVMYVEVPRAEIAVGDGHSRVVRDDVVMNCLDGLSVGLHPTHLCRQIYVNRAICYACGVQATICGGRGSSVKSGGNKANEISIQSVDDIEKPDAAVGTNGPQTTRSITL